MSRGPTGSIQRRNAEMRSTLEDAFVRRYEFYANPGLLVGAVEAMHRAWDGTLRGGGAMMYGWLADRLALSSYIGSVQLTGANIAFADFAATLNGGPTIDLDGATEHVRIADAAWQEAGANALFMWHWANAASLAATMTIASKYDTNGNNCSWRLVYNQPAGAFQFVVNGTGNPANDVPVSVTYTEAINTWYFVAGYYNPGTFIRGWVGAAADGQLTPATVAAGIPAALFNGNAPLAIGTSFNVSPAMLNGWNGKIGVGGARVGPPPGTAASYDEVNGFAARLYGMTRWLYLE